MNGSTLTLGLVAGLALGAAMKRGSRSTLSDERLLKLACVGMCGEFAAALHREFDYPLGAFYEVGPDGWKAGDYTLIHAFAYHPSGKLVDSKGIRSKAQMKSELYTMDGGKVKEAKTTEGDLDALSMEGLDPEVLEAARSYLQRNRAAFDADAGRAARRGSRSTGGTYFHVTTIDGANAILRDGFRAGPGICGRGVYLWDDLWYAQQMAQDEGDDAVILAVNPEDTELYACDEADVQDEGDSAYYDHVVIARVKSRWKPKMRVLE